MANNDFGRLQPVEYDDYPLGSAKGSPPKRGPNKRNTLKKTPSEPKSKPSYTPEELKKIGDVCKNRLPPASAVQAMFLCV